MSIFNTQEKVSCQLYRAITQSRFGLFEPDDEHIVYSYNPEYNLLFFVMKGEVVIRENDQIYIQLNTGQFCLLKKKHEYMLTVSPETSVVSYIMCQAVKICQNQPLDFIRNYANRPEKPGYTLIIAPQLNDFLIFLGNSLRDNIACWHFQDALETQMTILLRSYYEMDQLGDLFSPILTPNIGFYHLIVSQNYDTTVSHLAKSANMSRSAFNRRFKSIFREPAHQWLTKRRAQDVYSDIVLTDKSLSEIAEKFHFSSQAYLTTFCKKHFNQTPLQIRSVSKLEE